MNKIIGLLLSTFTLISCKTSEVEILEDNGLLIENAQIISPENQTISADSIIIVDGDSTVYVDQVVVNGQSINRTNSYLPKIQMSSSQLKTMKKTKFILTILCNALC